MKLRIKILLFFFTYLINAQIKFKVEERETETWRSIYSLIDEKGKTIKVLDSAKYYHCISGFEYGYFAIFGKKDNPGWSAIDSNENVLFQVYNTSFGEPSPDYLIENKIRIVGENYKIGFANDKGKIIIKPKFEIASSFHKGKAIIGEKCEKILWDKHAKEGDCHHYSIECKNYGYINEKGEVLKLGKYKFEKIAKEINWKPDENY